MHKKLKVIISGGGTGGHIFPAIAIADTLKKKLDQPEILFIGAKGRMEMEKVPAAGYDVKGLWISGFQRSLSARNFIFPFKLISSLITARRIIKKFKPDIVIGTGGYASGPTLRMASRMKIPAVIQEQNSFPGITNRLLSRNVNRICVAYDGMEKYFPSSKIVITGNPVRSDILNITDKTSAAKKFFQLQHNKPVVLIIGGSQGARAINEAILAALDQFSAKGIQMIWQTGKLFYGEALSRIEESGNSLIKVHAFLTRMDLAYSAADIIVSRAGAIAISEICVVNKPAIFVPLPTAAEDHQTRNARSLVDKNAAVMITNNRVTHELPGAIIELLNDKPRQEKIRKNLAPLAIRDANERITHEIIKLLDDKVA